MKAVVMTLALSNNYGAALQSYAFVKALEEAGASCEVYNYVDKRRFTYHFSMKRKIRYYTWKSIRWCLTLGKKERAFAAFRKEYLPLTKQKYKKSCELKKNPGDYDVYIAGSDQIWNPDIFTFDTSYFLDFVPSEKRKISYASSFGKGGFPEDKKEACGELLKEFDSISVREKSGVEIVKEISQQTAEWVLDPTLLLEAHQWDELLKKRKITFKGIFCYIMPGDKKVEAEIEAIAKRLQKQTGLPIFRLGLKEYQIFKYGKKGCQITAGPLEFLSYLRGAEYVVTNSFHGTAFSLIFKKKFYVPINYTLATDRALHERITSLLTLIGANEAMIPVGEEQELKMFDMDRVQEALSRERERSLAYLKKAVNPKC